MYTLQVMISSIPEPSKDVVDAPIIYQRLGDFFLFGQEASSHIGHACLFTQSDPFACHKFMIIMIPVGLS
jgi:hypothetical protein